MYCIVFVKNAESKPKIDKLNFQKIFLMNWNTLFHGDCSIHFKDISPDTLTLFQVKPKVCIVV